MKMATSFALYILPVVVLVLFLTPTVSCVERYKHEARSIMKRMTEADDSYEGHDVARVHLVEGQGQRGRRLVKRDLREMAGSPGSTVNAIQLDLASGSQVNLSLKRAGIVGPDTVVSFHGADGHVETNQGKADCYSHGEVEDSSGKGWAAISHCDGVFGFASSPEYEYFVHPVGSERSKRETNSSDSFDVHVLWRQLESKRALDSATDPSKDTVEVQDYIVLKHPVVSPELGGSSADRLMSSRVVVEMAMFTDAQYWRRLHSLYPGREDDLLLTKLAGTQALYSNRDKVGYDVQIKVKLLDYWTTNPRAYKFAEKLSNNLNSFCRYTRKKYFYDVHALNTGVWNPTSTRNVIGLAYMKGACTRRRCFVSKGLSMKSFILYAHELGHSLGMPHQSKADCPAEMKTVGGFMGGGHRLNFSPCMKHTLKKFLESSRSNCLFRESGRTATTPEFNNLPSVFPGQARSPDDLCRILAGTGYGYVPFGKTPGVPVCQWMVCLNEDPTSLEFGRARRFLAPEGFPCGSESFCIKDATCKAWDAVTMALDVGSLRASIQTPQWSQWSSGFSNCSRSCGTGVRTRRRECRYPGLNLAPHCPGMAVKAELCNTVPCPGDPRAVMRLRKVRGDEVCARLLRNNVWLKLNAARGYLATSSQVTDKDVGTNIRNSHSPSCMMKCDRDPTNVKGDLDAFLPDGTPCRDKRSWKRLRRLNIAMKCVRGYCIEFPK